MFKGVAFLAIGAAMNFGSAAAQVPAEKQQAFAAYQQAIVDGINAYRALNSTEATPRPPVTPLKELATAAREQAEVMLGNGTPSYATAVDRALDLGYGGGPLSAISARSYFSVNTLLLGLSSDASIRAGLLDPDTAFIGVGLSARAQAGTGTLHVYLLIGERSVATEPAGEEGVETDSGRGLPGIASLGKLFDGSLTGDSQIGFQINPVTGGLTLEKATGVRLALRALTNRPIKLVVRKGARLNFRLPSALRDVVVITPAGKLPPGVTFRDNALTGKLRRVGTFRPRLNVALPFEIAGNDTAVLRFEVVVRE